MELGAISFILLLGVSLFAHFCLVKATRVTMHACACLESQIVVERNDIVLDRVMSFE